jgi:hypothetical protein
LRRKWLRGRVSIRLTMEEGLGGRPGCRCCRRLTEKENDDGEDDGDGIKSTMHVRVSMLTTARTLGGLETISEGKDRSACSSKETIACRRKEGNGDEIAHRARRKEERKQKKENGRPSKRRWATFTLARKGIDT